jgi:dTDP-4-dehydrorhamnose reductase
LLSPAYLSQNRDWLYGIRGDSFPKKVLRSALKGGHESISVVNDQFGSPTWSYRVAQQIKVLIDNGREGVYHATSEGYCSRYEWAKYFLDRMEIKTPVVPCASKDYPTPAVRPVNSILENRQLKREGLNVMPNWQKDLDLFIDKYGGILLREEKEATT